MSPQRSKSAIGGRRATGAPLAEPMILVAQIRPSTATLGGFGSPQPLSDSPAVTVGWGRPNYASVFSTVVLLAARETSRISSSIL